jgi:hypothetical protein
MALTRDQFDVIANSYNDRQLNNKIKMFKIKIKSFFYTNNHSLPCQPWQHSAK